MAITLDTFRAAISSSSIQGSENISVTEDWSGNRQISVVKGKGDALDTRRVLLAALKQRFDNNIPKSVLKAMNVSKAFSGFSVGKNGEVKVSNHPLSARRLQTILQAVDNETVNKAARLSLDLKQLCKERGLGAKNILLLSTYCFQLGNQLGTEKGREKIEHYCKEVLHLDQKDEQIKSLAKALTELPQRAKAEIKAKNDGFTIIEMTEPDHYGEAQAGALKGVAAFEEKTGLKLSPFERRVSTTMVDQESFELGCLDLSVPENAKKLADRIADLRNGDTHGAGEPTLRLMSAIMYANPKLKPAEVRLVLKMAGQCKENGIAQIKAKRQSPLECLKEMAKCVASAIKQDYLEWEVEGLASAAFHKGPVDAKCAQLNDNEDCLRLFNLLMYALSAEVPELADTIKALKLDDVATCRAQDDLRKADLGVRLTPNRQRIDELMGINSLSVDADLSSESFQTRISENVKKLSDDDRKELERLQDQEVEMFLSSRFVLSSALIEAASHFDSQELVVRADEKYGEMSKNRV